MADNDFEKTETPTPRRREEARQEGNVARSSDLTAACILLASVLLLYLSGRRMMECMSLLLKRFLMPDQMSNPTRIDGIGADLALAGKMVVETMWPLVLGIVVVALVATLGQVGFLFTTKPLQPNFGRMSPLRGVKNLVDIRAGVRLVMGLAKIVAIAAVAAIVIVGDIPQIITLAELETKPIFTAAADLVFALGIKLSLLLLLLAMFDFAFQKWQRERDLRMTKQDVKEELKRMEGDPLIKHRRARVARQLALQRIGHAVPKADVVVTNPTHYAVALNYDSKAMKAPKVTAKGADYLATRIRQLAAVHGVPMIERRELAQAMYKTVEVGQEVPPQYYGAIAEILAYVYRLGGLRSA